MIAFTKCTVKKTKIIRCPDHHDCWKIYVPDKAWTVWILFEHDKSFKNAHHRGQQWISIRQKNEKWSYQPS